ncbi:hypothetical protein [Escherichia coli]|uniref:hypothetical protein n=1 Tax=Escherichia coli TaxID=562 RepID=UPI003F4C5561
MKRDITALLLLQRADTDHRQRSCRAASAGAVKRGARRHLLLPAKQNPKTTHTQPNKTPKQDK